jgi:hypothetical protein
MPSRFRACQWLSQSPKSRPAPDIAGRLAQNFDSYDGLFIRTAKRGQHRPQPIGLGTFQVCGRQRRQGNGGGVDVHRGGDLLQSDFASLLKDHAVAVAGVRTPRSGRARRTPRLWTQHHCALCAPVFVLARRPGSSSVTSTSSAARSRGRSCSASGGSRPPDLVGTASDTEDTEVMVLGDLGIFGFVSSVTKPDWAFLSVGPRFRTKSIDGIFMCKDRRKLDRRYP